VCIVDLFAIDEVRWIGQPGYADRICVLNGHVRDFLVQAGRRPDEIVVTGNPAFDALHDAAVVGAGRSLRAERGWQGRGCCSGRPRTSRSGTRSTAGRATRLAGRVLQALVDWTLARPDVVLCVRARAGQPLPQLPESPQVLATGQDWPLHPLLHAVDPWSR
jgi:hypothetical protein